MLRRSEENRTSRMSGSAVGPHNGSPSSSRRVACARAAGPPALTRRSAAGIVRSSSPRTPAAWWVSAL